MGCQLGTKAGVQSADGISARRSGTTIGVRQQILTVESLRASSPKAAITPGNKFSAALLGLNGNSERIRERAASRPPPCKDPGTYRAGRALAQQNPLTSPLSSRRVLKTQCPLRRLITPAACTSRPRKKRFELALRPRAPSTPCRRARKESRAIIQQR
jgi:hypothetical protein